jgi:glycosyltransferase involved in cell wall biosynthesis
MRVAVDAHAIGQRLTGNEVYVRNLLCRYPLLEPAAEFITYVSSPDAERWIPEHFSKRPVSKNPFVRLGKDLGTRLREDRPDLVHVQYTAPLRCPVPIVVTIHDVSYMEHPEYFPTPRAWQLRISTRQTIKQAAKIITVSEFSRQRISKVFGVDPDDITVTPEAAEDCFRPINRDAARAQVAEKLRISGPYLLHVGDWHPRKNQVGLIRAFRELLAAHPDLPHKLVLTGKRTWFARRVLDEIRRSGLEERIVLTDFVDDDILPALYNAADVFIFPSFYEGFGLPALEAMACGRPVVCSETTALPEVVDGAALLFDPHSIREQMRAVSDLLLDKELYARMEKKSLQRAACFDWRDTARRTLDVYAEVASNGLPAQRRKELVAR